jgi:hypothetical protein
MSNTRLYIDGQEVTTDQSSVDVTLSYSIESIVPGEIQGAHSKRTVKLPATKENIQLFEYIAEPGANPDTAYKYLPARLQTGGLPILTGKARLQNVGLKSTTNGFEPNEFKVGLFGNNADWAADVGNQLVRDLGWGQVTVSVAEIEQNRNPLTNEFAWILVKWQEWQQETSVTHTEFTPAIFIWQILEKAFGLQGYQLISNFKADPFNRLVIPVPKNLDPDYLRNNVNLRVSNASPSSFVNTLSSGEFKISFTDETTDPNFDTGANYASGTYTVPLTALYDIIAELNFNLSASSADPLSATTLILEWRVNGAVVAIYLFVGDDYDWNNPLFFNLPVTFELIQDLNEGDTVELFLRYDNISSLSISNISGFQTVEAEKESFNLAEVYNLSDFISSSWYVRDVIKDLTFIFNLAWETDVAAGKVYTYPKDNHYLTYRANASGAITTSAFGGFFQDTNLYDLSVREVQGGEMELIDGYKRNTILAYATDDPTTESEERRRGVNIYSGGYQFPEDRFENGIDFLYTNFFAKCIQINDDPITASSAMYGVQIPLIYGDDYNTTIAAKPNYYLAPKLLYYAGRRGGLDGRVNLFYEATSATSAFDYPAAFVTNYIDPSAGDWSLSFSDESTNYLQTVPGLFRTMYMQEFKRREIGKRYTMKADWSLTDVVGLSFRRKTSIGSSRFILQNLDYNPNSTNFSKTVILYDQRPNVTDLAKIINTANVAGANAQPGTLTGSGSGLVGGGGTSVSIYLSQTEFLNSYTNVLVLDMASGITKVPTAAIKVEQNGQGLLFSEYSISGVTVTIDSVRHFDGANYVVFVNGVTKG